MCMNKFLYLDLIAITACGLAFCLSLSLFTFIQLACHRGSGRAVATAAPEETIKPGDGRQ